MKFTSTAHEATGHNRKLRVTELTQKHPSDLAELEILVNYTGEGNAGKAIPLDNEIIPYILRAVEFYDACKKNQKHLKLVVDLAGQNALEHDEGDADLRREMKRQDNAFIFVSWFLGFLRKKK